MSTMFPERDNLSSAGNSQPARGGLTRRKPVSSSMEVVQSKQGSLMSADSPMFIRQVKTSSLGERRAAARSNELANLAV